MSDEMVSKVSWFTKTINGIIKGFCWILVKLHIMSTEKYEKMKVKQAAVKKAGAATAEALEYCIQEFKTMKCFSKDFEKIIDLLKSKKLADAMEAMKNIKEDQAFTVEVKNIVGNIQTKLTLVKNLAEAIKKEDYDAVDKLICQENTSK